MILLKPAERCGGQVVDALQPTDLLGGGLEQDCGVGGEFDPQLSDVIEVVGPRLLPTRDEDGGVRI